MEHADAIAIQATERYLLGELNDDETNAFEEHYFDCRICAEDVRTGMALFEGGRRLVREEPAPIRVVPIAAHPCRRWGWMHAAVAAMLAYPITFVPLLMRTQAAATMVVSLGDAPVGLESVSRAGETGTVLTLKGDEPGVLYYELPGEPHARYEMRVLGPDGKVLDTRAYTREEVGDESLSLTIQGAEAGTYSLVISGAGPAGQFAEIERRAFVVKR